MNWLKSLREAAAAAAGVHRPVLAVDGNTARRSHDRKNGLGVLHCVTVWTSEYGLSLGQVARAEGSDEITAIGLPLHECEVLLLNRRGRFLRRRLETFVPAERVLLAVDSRRTNYTWLS